MPANSNDNSKFLDLEQVRHIAKLANLALKPEEETRVQEQLNQILDYFKVLTQLDTEKVSPLTHSTHSTDNSHAFGEDRVQPGLPIEDVLKNAPQKEDRQFRVPAVIE